jgi:hypothetical protein
MSTVPASEIAKKLAHSILPNWALSEEQFGFLVTAPKGSAEPELQRKLQEEAWRLAKIVCYKKFTSIEKTPEGAYLIYSKEDADTWFQILLDKE